MTNFTLSKWTNEDFERLASQLDLMADPEYCAFNRKLIDTKLPMRGIRIPQLKKLAQEIARGGWKSYLDSAGAQSYEEVLLTGLVIGAAKGDVEEILTYVRRFVPLIDNWGVNDSFTSALKLADRHLERVWAFLGDYFFAPGEFEVRFSVTMLLGHYILSDYIDRVLGLLDEISHEGYYVKMAVAWALSVCYVKFPQKTMLLFKDNRLDDFTYNKALQKILESNRVSDSDKSIIRGMKRK